MISLAQLQAEDGFEDLELVGLDIRQTPLSGKEFHRCTFRRVILQDSRLGGVRLAECTFEDCDLANIRPQGARMQEVHFVGCKIVGTEWTQLSPFPQMEFQDCHLNYCTFFALDLTATPFLQCQAAQSSFVRVDLTETDFSGTDLAGARFEDCQLRKADFSQAAAVFIDSRCNRVKDAIISVDSAALVALSLGFQVAGFETKPADRAPRRDVRKPRK